MEKKFNPRVSIVIPVFNGSDYVKDAIDSALSQTYKNTEIIVIINSDGPESKKIEEICKSYGDKIRYFQTGDGEVSDALNLGVEKMRGEYLLWAYRDLLYPEETETLLKEITLDENRDKNIVIGNISQKPLEQSGWQASSIFNPEVKFDKYHLLASKEFLTGSVTDDEIRSSLLQKLSEEEIREYVKDKVENYWSVYYSFKEIGYQKFPFVLLNRMHEIWGKEKKVSVIVPVYKVEKYIRKCLESLLEQTLMGLEIIVVNDGTPDNSAKIAEEYTSLCPSFTKIVHKENGGLGSARDKGLEYATGQYVGYVDSDDYVKPEMFERLYNKASKGFEVVMCEFTAVDDLSGSVAWEYNFPEDINSWSHSRIVMNSTLKLAPAAWNKLYKRELLDYISWGSGFFEDLQATPTYISYAKKVGFIRKPYYYYRVNREGSIMSTSRDDKRCLAFIESWENLLKYSNPEYREEIVYAVYVHIVDIVQAFPYFFKEYMAFFEKKKGIFEKNELIKEGLDSGELKNLFEARLVPNILFDDKIEVLQRENDLLKQRNTELEKENKKLEEERDLLKQRDIELEKENKKLEEEKDLLKQRNTELEKENKKLGEERDLLKQREVELNLRNSKLEETISSMENSKSWRVTKPLRSIRHIMKK
jgi:glycosyltransferase involved in cell wall biosynthesis